MAKPSRALRPHPGELGLASWNPQDLAPLLSAAWDGFISLASDADLDAPTRLRGWRVLDVLVHVGLWEDEVDRLQALEQQARGDLVASADDVDARNARVVAAHHDATRAEIVAALTAARDRTARFLNEPDAAQIGRRWVGSRLGQLPLTGVLMLGAVELSVHALDVTRATGQQVPDALLDTGVAAVADVAGALVARQGRTTTLAFVTSSGCWATGTRGPTETDGDAAWTTTRLDLDVRPSELGWAALTGEAPDLLEAVSGRTLMVELLATRQVRVSRPAEVLRLLPALALGSGWTGGPAVEMTSRALRQAGRLAGRVSTSAGQQLARTMNRR